VITGYCVLWGAYSLGGTVDGCLCERFLPGSMSESVKCGVSLFSKRPIYACSGGHEPHERKFLGSTRKKLRLFEDDRGVRFELDAPLPKRFSGVSIQFRALEWTRDVGLSVSIKLAALIHIALLSGHRPAYPCLTETVKEVSANVDHRFDSRTTCDALRGAESRAAR
jgi:hypothetical protein